MKIFLFLVILTNLNFLTLSAQQQDAGDYKKGSYLYFGQPLIEDNSMYIEEAFNQEAGIVQHISNLILTDNLLTYSYTNEIPIKDYWHQFSFTALYHSNDLYNGFGDFQIAYRPMIWDKVSWALVTPRFSLLMPTGDWKKGLGKGAWGGQFNLAVTKRLSRTIVTHWNGGYTFYDHAPFYDPVNANTDIIKYGNLKTTNAGASLIWFLTPQINLMVEYAESYDAAVGDQRPSARTTILHPAARFAFAIGKVQVVPGAGIPMQYRNGSFEATQFFGYLSIEPNYNLK